MAPRHAAHPLPNRSRRAAIEGSKPVDLLEMCRREPGEHPPRLYRKPDQYTAPVAQGSAYAADKSQSRQPIDELDHAVVV